MREHNLSIDNNDNEEEEDSTAEQQLVKSGEDGQAIDNVLRKNSSNNNDNNDNNIVLPERTPAETEFMRVMQLITPTLDKPNKILKQFPGERGYPVNISVRKEKAPVVRVLLPVTQERNISNAQLVTDLLIKHAQEVYADLLTPADIKLQKIKAEQEAKQFKEDNPYLHLSNVPKYQRLEYEDMAPITDKKKIDGLIDILLQDARDLYVYRWGSISGSSVFKANDEVDLPMRDTRTIINDAKRAIFALDALQSSAITYHTSRYVKTNELDSKTRKELIDKSIRLLEIIYEGAFASLYEREEIRKRLNKSKIMKDGKEDKA